MKLNVSNAGSNPVIGKVVVNNAGSADVDENQQSANTSEVEIAAGASTTVEGDAVSFSEKVAVGKVEQAGKDAGAG